MSQATAPAPDGRATGSVGETAEVRQLHGRAGELWGAMSGADRLVVTTTR